MDLVILGTALVLGAAHTFEADHLAAVSAFVVRRPRVFDALGYGLRWAVGHGGAILVVGSLLIVFRLHLPESAGAILERLVGLSLVLLGTWVFVGARRLHGHGDGEVQAHHGAAGAMGALHGLAGTAPAVALLPLAGMESAGPAVLYLVAFGLGTAVSMAIYAMAAGWTAGRASGRSQVLGRGLARVAGLGSMAVGLLWLVG